MKDRLKEFLVKNNLSARQIADKLGVQPSSISHILNGRNKASVDLLEKMIRVFPEMDISYLISGIRSVHGNTNVKSVQFEGGGNDDSLSRMNEEDKEKKKTDRIVIFYSDGTFKEFFSE